MTGSELRAARERLNLTQAGLATLLGVHSRTVSAWEYGRQKCPAYVQLALERLEEQAAQR